MTQEEKVNVAELLKDCPKGMELDCTMYDNVTLIQVREDNIYPIKIETPDGSTVLTKYGGVSYNKLSKCVIYPKGKTTWNEFVPPHEIKDRDIYYIKDVFGLEFVSIIKKCENNKLYTYVDIGISTKSFYCDESEGLCYCKDIIEHRLATEEEKAKLFDAIKSHGYEWNTYTKTLEKLIEPKFKVGDEIVKRNSISNSWIVSSVSSEYYGLKSSNGIEGIGVLSVSEQDNYEILPKTDKFDVTNFEPFMKVLVRSDNSDVWECDFFSSYNPKCSNRFHCIGAWYNICIPYIGNEHLRGTTNDCDEFYKTWE